MQVGIYYYSSQYSSTVDIGLINPKDCNTSRHCIVSEEGYIMFLFEYTEHVTLNLVPFDEDDMMTVDLEYRLINNEEE